MQATGAKPSCRRRSSKNASIRPKKRRQMQVFYNDVVVHEGVKISKSDPEPGKSKGTAIVWCAVVVQV